MTDVSMVGHIYKFHSAHWLVVDELDRPMAGSQHQNQLYRHARLVCLEDSSEIDVMLSSIRYWVSDWKRVA